MYWFESDVVRATLQRPSSSVSQLSVPSPLVVRQRITTSAFSTFWSRESRILTVTVPSQRDRSRFRREYEYQAPDPLKVGGAVVVVETGLVVVGLGVVVVVVAIVVVVVVTSTVVVVETSPPLPPEPPVVVEVPTRKSAVHSGGAGRTLMHSDWLACSDEAAAAM